MLSFVSALLQLDRINSEIKPIRSTALRHFIVPTTATRSVGSTLMDQCREREGAAKR